MIIRIAKQKELPARAALRRRIQLYGFLVVYWILLAHGISLLAADLMTLSLPDAEQVAPFLKEVASTFGPRAENGAVLCPRPEGARDLLEERCYLLCVRQRQRHQVGGQQRDAVGQENPVDDEKAVELDAPSQCCPGGQFLLFRDPNYQ